MQILVCWANCLPSFLSSPKECQKALSHAEKGKVLAEKIDQKVWEILERSKWEDSRLMQFVENRVYLYCARSIYFDYISRPALVINEDTTRLLLASKEQNVKKLFQEIISCTEGMFAADMLSLDLPSTGPDGECLNLNLAPPIFCQRPDPTLDEQTRIFELYKTLVYRDTKNSLYKIEDYLNQSGALLRKKGVKSDVPILPDIIHKVIREKIAEIRDQVNNQRQPVNKQSLREAA